METRLGGVMGKDSIMSVVMIQPGGCGVSLPMGRDISLRSSNYQNAGGIIR